MAGSTISNGTTYYNGTSTQTSINVSTRRNAELQDSADVTVTGEVNASTTGVITVNNGAVLTANGNGTSINTSTRGVLDINGGKVQAKNNLNNSTHGTITLENSGSFAVGGTVNNSTSGTITVQDGGILSIGGSVNNSTRGTIVAGDNATINISGTIDNSTSGLLTIGNNSTISTGSVNNGTVSFSGTSALLTLGKSQSLNGTLPTITGFDGTSKIDLDGVSWSGSPTLSYANNTLTIVNNGTTIKWANFNLASGMTASDLKLEHEGDNSLAVVCFLPGTMIRTQTGLKTVETMIPGDRVVAFVEGEEVIRDVTWVGSRRVTPMSADDYPVRILAGALADNIPAMDLLVTPEHCLLIDGRFVPARMLVNGRSIVSDLTFGSYTVYHVETEGHSIISANNVLTESYLDTGNRASFTPKNNGRVLLAGIAPRKSWADAAAPLATGRDFVEPIFRGIEARAVAAGVESIASAIELTQDDDLHLQISSGEIIRPNRSANDYRIFKLPAGTRSVRLMSRTSRPSDVIGPFVDDRRMLGVLVGEIKLFTPKNTHAITSHLTETLLNGWDVQEAGAVRWTQGSAQLMLDGHETTDGTMLAIEIRSNVSYFSKDKGAVSKAVAA